MRGIGITGVVICAVISAFQLSHWRDSETLFRHALAVTSRNYVAEYNLGQALSVQGRIDEAVEHYYRALEVKSDHEGAHNNLGLTYAIHGEWTKATNHYAQGLEIAPTNGDIHFNMGIALLTLGDPTNANQHLQWTLKANPRHYLAHKAIGDASLAMKRFRDAADHYRKALHIKADQPEALNRLAWVLSTAPDTTLRNGKEAVQLAERACQLTNYQQPIMLITLATASAEAGDFNRAVDVVRQAETLAMLQGDRFTAERARQLRQEFEQNQPHREL
jgi:tetratricopeptide (TPR) repeat protein